MEQSTVDAVLSWQRGACLEPVAKALSARGFDVQICANRREAGEVVLAAAAEAHTIGFGGSMSVACLNVDQSLRNAGKELLIHGVPTLSAAEKLQIMRRQLTCDLFLASVNAVTHEGILVNIDGNGNRVCASLFGPRQILLVIGRNKIVHGTVADALQRIHTVAAPANAHRLGRETPCAKTGQCAHCAGHCPASICRITSIVEQCPGCSKVTLLLVNEDLGL